MFMKKLLVFFFVLQYLSLSNLFGQMISNYAGRDSISPTGYPYPDFTGLNGICIDKQNNFFVASDDYQHLVYKIEPNGYFYDFAGLGPIFSAITKVAVDKWRNVYVADWGHACIWKVDSIGIVDSFAALTWGGAVFVAVDTAGDVYTNKDNKVIKINHITRSVVAFAGNGSSVFSGDGGMAFAAGMSPRDIAFDKHGNIYIDDADNNRIRMINPTGIITTIAGGGVDSFGDSRPATNALIISPQGIAVDTLGNLFIADTYGSKIRKVTPGGIITTIAGMGYDTTSGTLAYFSRIYPKGITFASNGDMYVTDDMFIKKITPATNIITIYANTSDSVCLGTQVTFTVVDTSSDHHYQWIKNNINVGTDSINYVTDSLQNGDKAQVFVSLITFGSRIYLWLEQYLGLLVLVQVGIIF